jgi:hypothetical protein
MAKHDVTKTNLALEKLLEVTTNPRHRFLLMAFHRHRYLEISGRYEEIFAPEMMSEKAAYHMHIGCQRYFKIPRIRRLKIPQWRLNPSILTRGGLGCCDWRDLWRYRSCITTESASARLLAS